MEGLLQLRNELHEEVKALRNIDYYISRPNFENLWILSTPEEKEALKKVIIARNKESVINWYRNHPFIDIGEQSLVQLRETARLHRIHNYSRLSRIELLLAIKDLKEHPNEVKEQIKINYVPEIRKLVDLMLPIMLEATIPENYFDLPEESEFFQQDLLQEGYEWIEKIYNNEFRQAKNIKGLLSEEMWERYRTWADFGDHREVILLTEALQNLRKVVTSSKRPKVFKRTYIKTLIQKIKKEYGA